jgi:hypothetical protein
MPLVARSPSHSSLLPLKSPAVIAPQATRPARPARCTAASKPRGLERPRGLPQPQSARNAQRRWRLEPRNWPNAESTAYKCSRPSGSVLLKRGRVRVDMQFDLCLSACAWLSAPDFRARSTIPPVSLVLFREVSPIRAARLLDRPHGASAAVVPLHGTRTRSRRTQPGGRALTLASRLSYAQQAVMTASTARHDNPAGIDGPHARFHLPWQAP